MAAMQNVVSSPELLSMILSHLPMRDLLLAQRIDRYFLDVITSTPVLQEALFFCAEGKPNSYRVNPLLYEKFPTWFTLCPVVCGPKYSAYDKLDFHEDTAVVIDESHIKTEAHGADRQAPIPRADTDGLKGVKRLHKPRHMPQWKRTKKGEAFLREEASWRRMLVCQPPVQRLHVLKLIHGRGGDTANKGVLELSAMDGADAPSRTGLRMGILYDLTSQRNNTDVGVDFHMFDDQSAMDSTIPSQSSATARTENSNRETRNYWNERASHPWGKIELTKLGIMGSGEEYGQEMTLMDQYTQQCYMGVRSNNPDNRSDGHRDLKVAFQRVSPEGMRWSFSNGLDIAQMIDADPSYDDE